MELSNYGMSRERGYLSHYEIDTITLPSQFDPIVQAAGNLSALLTTGRVRHWLDALPDPQIGEWAKDAPEEEVRTAMVHYSFLVQAYVWGEDDPPAHLPANLSRPMVALADRLGQAPLLPYSGYVLDNWYRLDKSGPVTLDNIAMHQNFLGGADENWFVLVHVAIEAEAGVLLDNAAKLVTVCRDGDEDTALTLLREMDAAWERIYAHFARMPERCDPYVYFHRVRPYIHGWANNPALDGGLIYEGIERFGGKPQAFRGQTGSQSSIVPAMDALFQVGHSDDPLKSFLDELHAYRPVEHRRFIEDLAAQSTLRSFVADSRNAALKEAFNACLEQAARFRTRHLEYAASYINKQAGSIAGNDPDVGTGGTPFMKYLKKHRDENRAQVVD
ncbi:indoleamine 2,3-dioxygenase [Citromicrobium sp. RCC1885]|uniref:indoleamine 2,3-dioxygenase n=1 Tax=unclassified Citromicrobium TaxID=2630544 RepID=UPI0006C911C6|nr:MULTISPECIES: indoleamine 2,3-dioxygenase [unclassified Citromicrobium]KPM25571.1 indoleamine 2,3-dioxygenase [Citromicrobium sp. RCC1885]KPM28813.1 indoleamine 2,3-dioxygenase [Citromicrobium sp. RCC1878]MAO03661.1 indoleamine 2,3-dioxygenase [Citromicrobium sp.]OAM09637.1 indoleamine 2,3-dioxygenase [Citromicrobium sp. RCC1897]|tara:strand:- start:3004 stop:4167 length:1164 start_codon:yes stop_codon:yes gene_type:complete